MFLSILVILFGTISSGLSFFNVGVNTNADERSSFYISIIIGCISLFGAILSAVKSSLDYDKEIHELTRSLVKFSRLSRSIENILNAQCEYKPLATPWLSHINDKFAKYHHNVSYLRESNIKNTEDSCNHNIILLKKWNNLPIDLSQITDDIFDPELIIEPEKEHIISTHKSKKKKHKSRNLKLKTTNIDDNLSSIDNEPHDNIINV